MLVCLAAEVNSGGAGSDIGDGLTLVWEDNFNGSSLDERVWNYETGTGVSGWGNNEKQYYKKENVTVSGGYLTITARNESSAGMNYTSARITTKGKVHFPIGKIAARIKMPKGRAMWPAFWMLGANIDQNAWPRCGEIDIAEVRNGESYAANGKTVDGNKTVLGTAHWGISAHHEYGNAYEHGDELSAGFHEYAVEWDGVTIKWYLDNTLYNTIDLRPNPDTWGFVTDSAGAFNGDKFFYVLLNLAVGGDFFSQNANRNYTGTIASDEGKMIVDWVRAYSRKNIVIPY